MFVRAEGVEAMPRDRRRRTVSSSSSSSSPADPLRLIPTTPARARREQQTFMDRLQVLALTNPNEAKRLMRLMESFFDKPQAVRVAMESFLKPRRDLPYLLRKRG